MCVLGNIEDIDRIFSEAYELTTSMICCRASPNFSFIAFDSFATWGAEDFFSKNIYARSIRCLVIL